jgi:hypothetical protein
MFHCEVDSRDKEKGEKEDALHFHHSRSPPSNFESWMIGQKANPSTGTENKAGFTAKATDGSEASRRVRFRSASHSRCLD